MMYTRSHPSVYEDWRKLGNPGWGWSDVLRYFIKSEGNLNPELVEAPYHGFDGPLKVQRFNAYPPIGEDIIAAGRELGYSSPDFNGENQIGLNFAQVKLRVDTSYVITYTFTEDVTLITSIQCEQTTSCLLSLLIQYVISNVANTKTISYLYR